MGTRDGCSNSSARFHLALPAARKPTGLALLNRFGACLDFVVLKPGRKAAKIPESARPHCDESVVRLAA